LSVPFPQSHGPMPTLTQFVLFFVGGPILALLAAALLAAALCFARKIRPNFHHPNHRRHLGLPHPYLPPKHGEPLRGNQLCHGLSNRGILKLKPRVQENLWHHARARQETLLGEVSENQLQRKGRSRKDRRSPHRLSHRFGELRISNGLWRHQIHRSCDLLLEARNNPPDFICEVNPGHPLLPLPSRPPIPSLKIFPIFSQARPP